VLKALIGLQKLIFICDREQNQMRMFLVLARGEPSGCLNRRMTCLNGLLRRREVLSNENIQVNSLRFNLRHFLTPFCYAELFERSGKRWLGANFHPDHRWRTFTPYPSYRRRLAPPSKGFIRDIHQTFRTTLLLLYRLFSESLALDFTFCEN